MKKILLLLSAFVALSANAQHTISGTFTPAEDYTWLIAYRIKPGTQAYTADTAIQFGKATLDMPENAEPGMYRLVYAVPQEEYNFDVIYNGKEDIVFTFNSDDGAAYTNSIENSTLSDYLAEISAVEQDIITFYSKQKTNKKEFNSLLKSLTSIQENYETKSEGLIANHFITANAPYIPEAYSTAEAYVAGKKENYFKAIDFSNPVLQSSVFLTDKLTNYVFTALPLTLSGTDELEQEVIKNVGNISTPLGSLTDDFKFYTYYELWNTAVAYDYNTVSDYIYTHYLKDLAIATENLEAKNTIEAHNRLRIGEVAPEITWKTGKELNKLSGLAPAKNYVLIFWSSTCGHCLKELPALHKEFKNKTDLTVLAVGLEDEVENWEIEAAKLPNFKHAISLGKWDSEYAELYDVHATPTYYILDSEKRIIAKPEDDKAAVEFLKKIY
ncbi:TlpA disulfide reductase family protein [Cellulophaga sp. E6(2014)]|uniref:TlpA family protein disulfide reductase n=1 Tax=Cellulophaga sp. E6(2014) TaxID=1495334 RepID=UPI00051D7FA6|nr:TlpA disulfide reductase family protein [Cellulophaga sp. E6(2014)]KGK32072.1 thiol:disulfide interchange protein [Cellulophaga sp. E6(2014)]